MLSLPFPGVAASAQAPDMLWFQQLNLSLASQLASAETSLNSFARELGFIGRVATDLFLFGQNE